MKTISIFTTSKEYRALSGSDIDSLAKQGISPEKPSKEMISSLSEWMVEKISAFYHHLIVLIEIAALVYVNNSF